MTASVARTLNGLGLAAVSLILIVAFADQIVLGELPCPLCILQRVGFVGATLGLALNVKFGPRPSHYAVVIISAFAGAMVSLRQTLLHIVPGTGTYGSAIMGMHFYTWALVIYFLIILGCAVMLLFDRQFMATCEGMPDRPQRSWSAAFASAIIGLAALLALANGVSTVLECGGGLCPDNPVDYLLWPGRPRP
ncbi:MAG: disulfide bond formation protein B [Hyphomicrobiales bacterium]|nr:MAG: disulfide bond formation protein B [Hyphomicrobiales bacterium]